MKVMHSQKGMSVLGWMTMLAVAAFFVTGFLKMLPHYMDYMTMEKLITEIETNPTSEVRTVGQFYGQVGKGMEVNAIRDIDLKEALHVELVDNEFRVHLQFESREELIANLSLVATFDKEFRVRMP